MPSTTHENTPYALLTGRQTEEITLNALALPVLKHPSLPIEEDPHRQPATAYVDLEAITVMQVVI